MELTQTDLDEICVEVQEEIDFEFGIGPYSTDSIETKRGHMFMLGFLLAFILTFVVLPLILGL